MSNHKDTASLADYILTEAPEAGDEFIVRILDGNNDPEKSEPWARVYIRRANKDCETLDFRIDFDSESRIGGEDAL